MGPRRPISQYGHRLPLSVYQMICPQVLLLPPIPPPDLGPHHEGETSSSDTSQPSEAALTAGTEGTRSDISWAEVWLRSASWGAEGARGGRSVWIRWRTPPPQSSPPGGLQTVSVPQIYSVFLTWLSLFSQLLMVKNWRISHQMQVSNSFGKNQLFGRM